MALLADRVEKGKRALSLTDLEDSLSRDRQQKKEVDAQIRRLEMELIRLQGELSIASGERDRLQRLADEIPAQTAEKARLEGRLKLIEEVTAGEAALLDAEKNRTKAAALLEFQQRAVKQLEDDLTAVTLTIEELTMAVGRRGEVEQRLKEAEARASVGKRLAEAGAKEKKAAAGRDKHAAEESKSGVLLAAAIATHDELTRRLLQGQAARLAHDLIDGAPCPVCGSGEHPAPARGGDSVPTEEEVEAARLAVEQARAEQERTRALLAGSDVTLGEIRAGIAALQEQMGEHAGSSPDELTAVSSSLQASLEALIAREKELTRVRSGREELTRKLETDKQRMQEAVAALQLSSEKADSLKGQLQARASELEGHERDPEAVKVRIAAIGKFIAQTDADLKGTSEHVTTLQREVNTGQGKREESRKGLELLDSRLLEGEGIFSSRLARAGFADESDYRNAKLTQEDLERSETALAAYREKVTAAVGELAQAEEGCAGAERPDLDGLSAAKTAAELEVTALAGEQGGLRTRIESLRSSIAAVEEYRKETEEEERQYRVVGNLANLAAGNNPKRITLQRFVLASLFEEVALAASARLSRMSRGRYHLRRSESVVDARKGAGLDLEVTDDFTGLSRPASSLSGGETFLASLSLALGLSDIVLAQSGGRYLDTLFIDEGFGTLDPETLDIAMDTLIRLNEQGRMVGIISHVTELKEQIPKRLEVVAGRSGSRVKVVC